MYLLERTQNLLVSVAELWQFVQNPMNLNDITPPELCFRIVNEVPVAMHEGLIIEYHLRVPWFGCQHWVTEIKHIRENRSFVDEQRLGPYRFWYHFHEVVEASPGVRMIDQVHYQLPYSFFGRLLHRFIVKDTLERIFDYRHAKLAERFGTFLDSVKEPGAAGQ